jgi:Chondroitin N-acetylgalactosaminyltransferase
MLPQLLPQRRPRAGPGSGGGGGNSPIHPSSEEGFFYGGGGEGGSGSGADWLPKPTRPPGGAARFFALLFRDRARRQRAALWCLASTFLVACFYFLLVVGYGGAGSAEEETRAREVRAQVAGIEVPLMPGGTNNATAATPSARPVAWWRCAGSRWFEDRINSHNAAVFQNFNEVARVESGGGFATAFRARTCFKVARAGLASSTEREVTLVQLHEWTRNPGGGVSGIADLAVGGDIEVFEYFDDLAREPRVWRRRDLESSNEKARVVIVTTAFQRGDQMRRFATSLRDMQADGEKSVLPIVVLFGEEAAEDGPERTARRDLVSLGAKIIRHELPFDKVSAMNRALADSDLRPDDIVFFVDIDVTFPPNLAALARRFCRSGSRGFAPMVWYRGTDENGVKFPGFADDFATGGTGVIALYKQDIDRFGGFDGEAFGSSHGFEDTDFFFRARYSGVHLVRFPLRSLEHWPHSRGVWQDGTDEDTDSDGSIGCAAVEAALRVTP